MLCGGGLRIMTFEEQMGLTLIVIAIVLGVLAIVVYCMWRP